MGRNRRIDSSDSSDSSEEDEQRKEEEEEEPHAQEDMDSWVQCEYIKDGMLRVKPRLRIVLVHEPVNEYFAQVTNVQSGVAFRPRWQSR